MYQRWRHLLFLHWPVAAETLAPLLPPGLELDTFEGKAYVGLVPFTMTGIRPTWLPALPGLSRFHEVNVRTYVHALGRDPGVWFFSLDAANPLAVLAARRFYHLPYYAARIRLQEETHPPAGELEVAYHAVRQHAGPRPASCTLGYRTGGQPAPARPGSLEHFLIERYILYAHAGDTLFRGRVHHAPYQVQPATLHSLQENLLAAAGITPAAIAPLVHYVRGVDVEIFPLEVAAEQS
jgi:hypothetical protein